MSVFPGAILAEGFPQTEAMNFRAGPKGPGQGPGPKAFAQGPGPRLWPWPRFFWSWPWPGPFYFLGPGPGPLFNGSVESRPGQWNKL